MHCRQRDNRDITTAVLLKLFLDMACVLQLENEYGFIGDAKDKHYMRHLVKLARKALGDEIVLFTTDPPGNVEKGSLPGDEIFR